MSSSLAIPLAKRWSFAPPADPAAAAELARELRLPPSLCQLLAQRGFGSASAARGFLRPHQGQLADPARLAGMGNAVARVAAAVRTGETILVHGDYDVDGICATALLVRALTMLGGRAVAFVPHRMTDGYDLSDAGVAAASAAGAGLILTVDCGIVAHAAVDRARAAGIDVVVTDHHTPGATLPAAVAVVNSNRADCPYPTKDLCGTGVAFKLACALAAELGAPEERLHALLDLVAIATIADLMPLVGENRALVRWGLRVLSRTPNPGLRALLASSGLADKGEPSAGQVGFVLAPRLNAAGRMGAATRGVHLLLTDDAAEAERIAASLEAENRTRQAVDGRTLREALAELERSFDPDRDRGVVLAGDGWHPGVIGIVASRVVERIHRPTVMIALDGDHEGKGSARSVPGFHLWEALHGCSAHLTRFGGHRYAAGCGIAPRNVDAFRAAFDAHAQQVLSGDLLIPELRVDAEIALEDATPELVSVLRHAGPFGMGNPHPVFAARRVAIQGTPRVVGERHLKLTLAADGRTLDAIGFGMADRLDEWWSPGALLDAAFRLEENEWQGRTSVQAKLVDVRPA